MPYLRNHEVTFEPIDRWPGKLTARRKRSPFSAPWGMTLKLLDDELWELRARNVVIRCELDRTRIRNDGAPRSDARVPPPIILSFASKHGPIEMPCDTFDDWQANVRAIALALEALRKVDRYGVTQRAEQYRGWQALPRPGLSPGDEIRTATDAVEYLKRLLRLTDLDFDGDREQIIRDAQRKTHPDRGGNADDFKRVMKCEQILTGAA